MKIPLLLLLLFAFSFAQAQTEMPVPVIGKPSRISPDKAKYNLERDSIEHNQAYRRRINKVMQLTEQKGDVKSIYDIDKSGHTYAYNTWKNGALISTGVWEFDEYGNYTKHYTVDYDTSGKITGSFIFESYYQLSSTGASELVVTEIMRWSGFEDGIFSDSSTSTTTFEYDKSDKLTRKVATGIFGFCNAGPKPFNNVTTYTYDSTTSSPEKSEETTFSGGCSVLHETSLYKYTYYHDCIFKELSFYDGKAFTKTIHEYDANWNRIRTNTWDMDYNTVRTIEYKYNESGLLVSTSISGKYSNSLTVSTYLYY